MSVFQGRFAGRTAVITGGASGLGKSTAARIVREGGRVVLWDMNPEALDAACAETGAAASSIVDVANPQSVEAAAAEALNAMGKIDILVCSAGITGATVPVVDYPVEEWQRVLEINLYGAFYCNRAIVPAMIEQGYGRIVNVSSVAGKEGNPNACAYSASKAGVIALSKSLGKELAGKGVIVNSLTPATFDSPLLSQLPQSHIDYMLSRIPMGRLGQVEESTAMVCFMVSDECSFTTASTFDTSGGRTTY